MIILSNFLDKLLNDDPFGDSCANVYPATTRILLLIISIGG